MGLLIRLENESGHAIKSVADPMCHLWRLLPSMEDKSSPLLKYIDLYGDTVFNELQMDDVLHELRAMLARVRDAEEKALVDCLIALAEECKEQGLFLKFYGE